MLTLRSNRLCVEVSVPGEDYKNARFDWTGIIKQVTLDDRHSYLSYESDNKLKAKTGGIGIIGAFEPKPRIISNKALYMMEALENEINFAYKCTDTEGLRGIEVIKNIRIEENRIILSHNIINLGIGKIVFGEYNHNFMLINNNKVNQEYELTLPVKARLTGRKEGRYDIINTDGNTLTFSQGFDGQDEDALIQLDGYKDVKHEYSWELTHKPTGAGVKEIDDFIIRKYQFWCMEHTICSEVFLKEELAPSGMNGCDFEWNRIYEFY